MNLTGTIILAVKIEIQDPFEIGGTRVSHLPSPHYEKSRPNFPP